MQSPLPETPYLSIEPDGEDIAGITIVADFCPFLEMINIHLPRLRATHHNYQTTREETFHNVNIWDFICIIRGIIKKHNKPFLKGKKKYILPGDQHAIINISPILQFHISHTKVWALIQVWQGLIGHF